MTTPPATHDDQQQHIAQRIGRANPQWLVMRGVYSRCFWAFPLFSAHPGTIISAPDPTELLTRMRRAEVTAQHPPT